MGSEYEKSKIDIKLILNRKNRTTIPSTNASHFYLHLKRRRFVTSAKTPLHASFPGSAYFF